MKEDYQDRIDEYLLKRMSPEDCMAFENEVAENQELHEQLSFTEEVRHAMRSRNEKLAKMEEWEKETESKSRLSKRRLYYWVSGIAALFIVGFITISRYLSSFDKGVGTEYAQTNLVQEEESADIEKLLAYNKYSTALEKINREIETELHEISFGPGCAEDEGIEIIDSCTPDTVCIIDDIDIKDYSRENSKEEFREESREKSQSRLTYLYWLKVKALIGLNRIDEALPLLEDLRRDSEYGLQADSLYKLLKR